MPPKRKGKPAAGKEKTKPTRKSARITKSSVPTTKAQVTKGKKAAVPSTRKRKAKSAASTTGSSDDDGQGGRQVKKAAGSSKKAGKAKAAVAMASDEPTIKATSVKKRPYNDGELTTKLQVQPYEGFQTLKFLEAKFFHGGDYICDSELTSYIVDRTVKDEDGKPLWVEEITDGLPDDELGNILRVLFTKNGNVRRGLGLPM